MINHKINNPDAIKLSNNFFEYLNNKRRSVVPVVNNSGELVGIQTRVGALRAALYEPAVDDKNKLRKFYIS